MNFAKRFENAITNEAFCVTVHSWVKQDDFAETIIREFNAAVEILKHAYKFARQVEDVKGWPTTSYLMDMPRRFMMKRYGWNLNRDYRQWCKENPGKILVLEVFGNDAGDVCLEMKYDGGFFYRLR